MYMCKFLIERSRCLFSAAKLLMHDLSVSKSNRTGWLHNTCLIVLVQLSAPPKLNFFPTVFRHIQNFFTPSFFIQVHLTFAFISFTWPNSDVLNCFFSTSVEIDQCKIYSKIFLNVPHVSDFPAVLSSFVFLVEGLGSCWAFVLKVKSKQSLSF